MRRRRTRRNPASTDSRDYYAGIFSADGRFLEAFQSSRNQALAHAARRARDGEIVRGFRLDPQAPCLHFVEAFMKKED
jgi:hypothetical protein